MGVKKALLKKVTIQKINKDLMESREKIEDRSNIYASYDVADNADALTRLYFSNINTMKTPIASDICLTNMPPQISNQEVYRTTHSANLAKKLRISSRSLSKLSGLRRYIKDTGIYALSSVVIPMVTLVLTPFLTNTLSTSDYGILTLLNIAISLGAGITQLGLSSAFFRAYNYDYAETRDKQSVAATTTALLFIVSLLLIVGVIFAAPSLATLLLRHSSLNNSITHSSLSNCITVAGGVIFAQNLTIPVFSWLRAEGRAFFYSMLSISNVLVTLVANITLVGFLHWKVAGALIAAGCGYIGVVIIALPPMIFRTGMHIRIDIARNLLGFGVPLIFGFISYWVLQISDRYLLSYFSSPAETARYAVAYTLGTAISVVVIGPFTLAWPMIMFTIAKSEGASDTFQLIFRYFSLFLLFASFCLSCIGMLLLNWLFPIAYHSVSLVIPVVSISAIFYGLYYIFAVGINIKRKMWMTSIYISIAAVINFLLNLILIPLFGAMGAALSTLIAYIVLALITYIVNQKVYPITFEVGRFIFALVIGVILYAGCITISRNQGLYGTLSIYIGALLFYVIFLTIVGFFPTLKIGLNIAKE